MSRVTNFKGAAFNHSPSQTLPRTPMNRTKHFHPSLDTENVIETPEITNVLILKPEQLKLYDQKLIKTNLLRLYYNKVQLSLQEYNFKAYHLFWHQEKLKTSAGWVVWNFLFAVTCGLNDGLKHVEPVGGTISLKNLYLVKHKNRKDTLDAPHIVATGIKRNVLHGSALTFVHGILPLNFSYRDKWCWQSSNLSSLQVRPYHPIPKWIWSMFSHRLPCPWGCCTVDLEIKKENIDCAFPNI